MQGAKRARTDTKVAAVEQAQNFVNENTKVQNFVNENAKKQDRRPNRSEAQTNKIPKIWAYRGETSQKLGSSSAKKQSKEARSQTNKPNRTEQSTSPQRQQHAKNTRARVK